MRNIESAEVRRNMGFYSEAVQQSVLDMTVGIAGTGGTGTNVAERAARLGFQRFVIADPEVMDPANSNRVVGAGESTMGRNKADVLRDEILDINPDAIVDVYSEGINPDNLEEFLAKRSPDIVVNALELKHPELGVMLARGARERKLGRHGILHAAPIPVLDVEYIAHAGQGTTFDPLSKTTFEKFMGIKGGDSTDFNAIKEQMEAEAGPYGYVPKHDDLDRIATQSVSPDHYLAYLPKYGDMTTFKALLDDAPLPSNAIGAGIAAQIATAELMKHARIRTGERTIKPTYAPQVRWYDAYTNESGSTRHPRVSFYKHLSRMMISNAMHTNDKASYTSEARAARGDFE